MRREAPPQTAVLERGEQRGDDDAEHKQEEEQAVEAGVAPCVEDGEQDEGDGA